MKYNFRKFFSMFFVAILLGALVPFRLMAADEPSFKASPSDIDAGSFEEMAVLAEDDSEAAEGADYGAINGKEMTEAYESGTQKASGTVSVTGTADSQIVDISVAEELFRDNAAEETGKDASSATESKSATEAEAEKETQASGGVETESGASDTGKEDSGTESGAKSGTSEESSSDDGEGDEEVEPEPIKVTSVKLNKKSASVYTGKTVKLSATVLPKNADNKAVTWKSSNSKVAKVTQKGVVTGVKKGTATITVTTKDGKKKATCKVTVKQTVKVTKVSLDRSSARIAKGEKLTLTAKVLPAKATNKAVTWKSSNTKVAKVSKTGVVTGVGKGTAKITVTTKDQKKKATCKVNVFVKNKGKSELLISSNTKVTVPASKDSFTVKGTATSNYKLKKIYFKLTLPSGKWKDMYYDYDGNIYEFDLAEEMGTDLNEIAFGEPKKQRNGKYKMLLEVTDGSGKTVSKSLSWTLKGDDGEALDTGESTLAFSSGVKVNVSEKKPYFSVAGKVTSNYSISRIDYQVVLPSRGKASGYMNYKDNYSVTLTKAIDDGLNKACILEGDSNPRKGDYSMTITVTDKKGKKITKTLKWTF